MNAPGQGNFIPKTVDITQVYGDLSQEVVNITVDRLSLILHRHAQRIGRRSAWHTPAGIFLALWLSLATTSFEEKLLSAAIWNAIFMLLTIASGLWLIIEIIRAIRSESVDDLVKRIKAQKV